MLVRFQHLNIVRGGAERAVVARIALDGSVKPEPVLYCRLLVVAIGLELIEFGPFAEPPLQNLVRNPL